MRESILFPETGDRRRTDELTWDLAPLGNSQRRSRTAIGLQHLQRDHSGPRVAMPDFNRIECIR